MVSIVIWNAGGINNKKSEIMKYIQKYDIVVITETKVSVLKNLYFSGFKTHKSNNLESNGGVAILIKNGIDFTVMKEWKMDYTNFDIIGVIIKSFKIEYRIIAVYRKPRGVENIRAWEHILKFDGVNNNSLIVGDFNAHHNTWNCENTDTNGERLYQTMFRKGYISINNDIKSRMNYYNQTASNIDLIFANKELPGLINYTQIRDTWGSDHYPIEMEIGIETLPYKKKDK